MQTNQPQTKTSHPMVNTILANLAVNTKSELVGEPLRSIDKVLQFQAQQAEAQLLIDTKLYTPAQNEALTAVQAAAYQIIELTNMINQENAVWNLGLPKINAYPAADMLVATEERIRILQRVAKERGVAPVIDNKGGASQHKASKDRRQALTDAQEKTAAYRQSQQIQQQKESA